MGDRIGLFVTLQGRPARRWTGGGGRTDIGEAYRSAASHRGVQDPLGTRLVYLEELFAPSGGDDPRNVKHMVDTGNSRGEGLLFVERAHNQFGRIVTKVGFPGYFAPLVASLATAVAALLYLGGLIRDPRTLLRTLDPRN